MRAVTVMLITTLRCTPSPSSPLIWDVRARLPIRRNRQAVLQGAALRVVFCSWSTHTYL